EIKANLLSHASNLPNSLSPFIKVKIPSGKPFSNNTSLSKFMVAIADKGAFSLGFQILVLPHTAAIIAFQLQTATGKLKEEIIPTGPIGCHCSYILCSGLSECMLKPYSCLLKPVA